MKDKTRFTRIIDQIHFYLNQKQTLFLFIAIGVVYFCNLFVDIMEIDAAQYAVISMEMSWTKSFLQVFEQGQDYLDKPPLLFWLSSLSFIVLGISNFAYKLPSVLIAILGLYSLYKFARMYYRKEVSILAVIILATSQALFLITNDVRTDTNLLGLTIFSVWQLSEYLRNAKLKNLILAGIGIGGAMLAKGPVALMIPAAAFGADLMIKRQWKKIFNPYWLLLIIVIAMVLFPMSYGLYNQFDLHPEKTVYGLTGPSGLRFFFWTQSFGRITGEIYWDNDAGFFYFFHTILWDFQPWVLFFIPALIIKIKKLIVNRFSAINSEEYISLGGFVLMFLALSMSNFKLPHYIFVLFPFAALMTAEFIYDLKDKYKGRIANIQFGIMHLFWAVITIYYIFMFPPGTIFIPLFLICVYIFNWIVLRKTKNLVKKIFLPTAITAIAFNLFMGVVFYPNLMEYQAGSQAGRFIAENNPKDVYRYNYRGLSFDFYSRKLSTPIGRKKIGDIPKDSYVVVSEAGMKEIMKTISNYEVVKTFPSYRVTRLKMSFLLKDSREDTLQDLYIIKII